MNLGFSEMLFIFLLALIVVGPRRLPELARQFGRIMAEVKRASNDFQAQVQEEVRQLEIEETAKKFEKSIGLDESIGLEDEEKPATILPSEGAVVRESTPAVKKDVPEESPDSHQEQSA
jgi:Tat protein translocase TatB subunit